MVPSGTKLSLNHSLKAKILSSDPINNGDIWINCSSKINDFWYIFVLYPTINMFHLLFMMASSSKISITSHHTPSPQHHQSIISEDSISNFSAAAAINLPVDLHHPDNSSGFRREYEKKLKAFKNVLTKERKSALEGLTMVDAIQRLGIDYEFQEEIDAILMDSYMNPSACHSDGELQEVALRFRLLRQEGYYVSADIFEKFRDEEGKFMERLGDDIKGLKSLYEASELSIQGEEILDEARNYSRQLLSSSMEHSDYPHAKAIEITLKHPHHKSLAKFIPKEAIANIDWQKGWMNKLQELAMFDYNMVRFQHQKEIRQISKWWKELGLSLELEFARNQPVKWYIWCMTVLTDPCLSEPRIELIKPISFVYLIDDIFDVHGTLDELILFTQLVESWDIAAIDQLPDYMRICFKALDDIVNELSYKVYEEQGWNPVDYLRKSWASLCNAFLVEARWFASGSLPNCEEYLKNGIVSSGVHVALVHLFFLLGQGVTKKNVEFLDRDPGIISSTAKILRLWDDLGSAKDENQDGHDGSYVECYMKEHEESSQESARMHVFQMISDTWKQLNQDCLYENPFSPNFTKACLNVARMIPSMYSYDENSCLPFLVEHINSLLCENLHVE